MKRLASLVLVAGVLAGLAGCGSDKPPPPKAPDTQAPSLGPTAKKDTATPSSGSIHIDDKIMKLCGDIPNAHFAFDSNSITPDVANALDAVAKCFVSGPGKGKGLKLIGHADPRGETEYNFALGQKRAGSVADYMVKKGLEQARINSSSKGELEATGTDENGWAKDRKVEIFLAE
jgi:peptidoglycan-associated lipoprotein